MAAADTGEGGNGVPVAVTVTEKKQQYKIFFSNYCMEEMKNPLYC